MNTGVGNSAGLALVMNKVFHFMPKECAIKCSGRRQPVLAVHHAGEQNGNPRMHPTAISRTACAGSIKTVPFILACKIQFKICSAHHSPTNTRRVENHANQHFFSRTHTRTTSKTDLACAQRDLYHIRGHKKVGRKMWVGCAVPGVGSSEVAVEKVGN